MNKTVRRFLIWAGSIIVILVLVMGGFMMKMKSEMKKMNVIGTKEIFGATYLNLSPFLRSM